MKHINDSTQASYISFRNNKSIFINMISKISIFIFVFILFVGFTTPKTTIDKLVDAFITEKMKELNVPGMAVAVIKDGSIVKMTPYGIANLEWNQPVSVHTNFQIASCSKLLASTIIMKLISENKISLEDCIGKYIDTIPPSWEDIQIKHILNHTSGIPSFNDPTNRNYSTATVVGLLKDSALLFPYGQKQEYSNGGYILIQYILESIFQKPYTQILNEVVSTPVKMKDGGFEYDQKFTGFYSSAIINEKSPTYYKNSTYKWFYPQYMYASAGYYASIYDLAQWAMALDKEIYFSKEIEMKYIYSRDSITAFSNVGWRVGNDNDFTFAGHSGGPGLGDIIRFSKEGYTFIVLSNDGEIMPDFARAIASFYLRELEPKIEIKKWDWQNGWK